MGFAMKFKIGQEVMIISGTMTGRKAKVLSHKTSLMFPTMKWYELEIKDMFDSIFYLACELEQTH